MRLDRPFPGPASGSHVGDRVFVAGARCFGEIKGLFGGAASRLIVPGNRAVAIGETLGEQGVLSAVVNLHRKPEGRRRFKEELGLGVGGIGKRDDEYLEWLQRKIRIGDEISIRIIEKATVDKPRKRRQRFVKPATQRRRKEALIRKMAKELGLKVETR